ncbi:MULTISPECIES: DUF397 domain-containing protein [Streptomyces]|uniref:DUF397 domain-containing protein n=1 Tax=Streptomyces TaxID=1883 RepID=UPI001D13BD22|nr:MULTISPECIES: DUF397 domain-containing protein [Streptomyces]MCC3653337.1 DUF397 domain-containing protein [Streptomyces sp. S07_1.15]WSQ72111.1 DUF397 domain-containing protein [Streptomyces xinghaiensis]
MAVPPVTPATPRAQGLSGAWRKSSYSGNGNCVEVAARIPGAVAVRDSKDITRPSLSFSGSSWQTFLADLGHRTTGLG